MKLFQYQGRAEPVPQAKERSTPDKWSAVESVPVSNWLTRSRISAACLVAATVFIAPPFPERTTPDRYDPGIQQPQFDKKKQQQTYPTGELVLTAAQRTERTTPDKWQPETNQPKFDAARRQYLYQSYASPDRQPEPLATTWRQQASERPLAIDRRGQGQQPIGDLVLTAAQRPEPVSPDRWQPLTNQPLFDVRRMQWLYQSAFAPERQQEPLATTWWQQASERPLGIDRRWQGQQPTGELVLTSAQRIERTTPDRYDPGIQQPLFDKKRAQHTYQVEGRPDRQPALSLASWWPQASEPLRLIDRRQQGQAPIGDLVLTAAQRPEITSPDRYDPGTQQPQFDVARRQYLYQPYFAPFRQPEPIIATWWQQASERPLGIDRRGQGQQPTGELVLASTQRPERASPDRWDPGISQPLFDRPRRQWAYQVEAAPARQPDSYLKDWAVQPALVLPRRTTALQVENPFVPVTTAPVPNVPSWADLAPMPVRNLVRAPYDQSFVPSTAREATSADRWHPAIELPRFDRVRAQHIFQSLAFNPYPLASPIFADSWHLVVIPPQFDKVRRQDLFPALIIDPAALIRKETVSADRWYAGIEVPKFKVPRWTAAYPAEVQPLRQAEPLEGGWLDQASEPVLARDRRQQGQAPTGELVLSSSQRPPAFPDRWYPGIVQPIFDLKRMQRLYPYLFESRYPIIPAVPSLASWKAEDARPRLRNIWLLRIIGADGNQTVIIPRALLENLAITVVSNLPTVSVASNLPTVDAVSNLPAVSVASAEPC